MKAALTCLMWRALCASLVKVWTKRRKINNAYRGTLSSYGYTLLVIHFLSQVKDPPVLPYATLPATRTSATHLSCRRPDVSLIVSFSLKRRNLQRIPPLTPKTSAETEFEGHDIYFFSEVDALPKIWQTRNTENVGELLVDFFRHFAKEFSYTSSVISIRSESGILSKESKGWNTDVSGSPRSRKSLD